MRYLKSGSFLTVLLMVFTCLQTGHASTVTTNFTARVSNINDQYNFLGSSVSSGDLITGYFTYNTEAIDTNPLTQYGSYNLSGIFQVDAGGKTFITSMTTMETLNNHPQHGDYVYIGSYSDPLVSPLRTTGISIWMQDWSAKDAINSDGLPTSYTPSAWDTIYVTVTGGERVTPYPDFPDYTEDRSYDFRADILTASSSITQTVVPEPISSILFVTGGALLAGRRFLRRKA